MIASSYTCTPSTSSIYVFMPCRIGQWVGPKRLKAYKAGHSVSRGIIALDVVRTLIQSLQHYCNMVGKHSLTVRFTLTSTLTWVTNLSLIMNFVLSKTKMELCRLQTYLSKCSLTMPYIHFVPRKGPMMQECHLPVPDHVDQLGSSYSCQHACQNCSEH